MTDKVGRAFRHGTGCRECHDTGFKGRLGIYEVMEVTPDLRRLIHRGAAAHQVRETARKDGVRTLSEEGAELALSGATALEEILRVTRNEGDLGAEEDVPIPPTDGGSAPDADNNREAA